MDSFNPRARVGRDQFPVSSWYGPDGFNPRARVGRDRPAAAEECQYLRFNPRARVGRDHIASDLPSLHSVSIHAPAWGATRLRRV